MHIASTINPLSRSNGNLPVAIFSYNDEKRFLRVSEDFEETIERVVESFRIPHGQTILLQTSTFTACRGSRVVIDRSAYPLLWSILEEIEVVSMEAILETGEAPKSDTLESVKEHFPTPTSPIAGPSGDGLGGQIEDVRRTPAPSEDELPTEDETPTAAAQAQAAPKSDPLFQWEDDIQQDTKQEEQVENVPATPQPARKFKPPPSSSTKPAPDAVPVIKKEKQRAIDTSASAKPGLDSPAKKASRSAMEDDARFEVVIVGPSDDATQFKLRGKNSVRKVLTAACRNFDVDPTRASLVHCMELEVDGEVQIHNFLCSPEDTIAMCGIKAGSKLFVKVDPVTEDDPTDYSSE